MNVIASQSPFVVVSLLRRIWLACRCLLAVSMTRRMERPLFGHVHSAFGELGL